MKMKAFLNAIPAGIVGLILSAVVGGLVIPFPADTVMNAVNNGISGLLSGLLGSFVTLLVFINKTSKEKSTDQRV